MNNNLSAGLPDVASTRESLTGRRRSLQNMMLTATIIFAAAACGGSAPESGSPAPGGSTPPHVVFYAEGKGTTSAAITLTSESGGTLQKDVKLPMADEATGAPGIASDSFKRGAPLYVQLQNKEVAGSVTCRIEVTVDGKKTVVDEATSSGAYKVVTCVGKVP